MQYRWLVEWLRVWVCFVCLVANLTHAQEPAGSTDSEARGLFEAGRAAFDGGRFSEALEHFEAAFALSDRAQLLYNIGHTAERLRNDARALEAFREYLRRLPEVDNRASVEARIGALEEQIGDGDGDADADGDGDADADADGTDARGPGPMVLMITGAVGIAGGVLGLGLAARAANEVEGSDVGTPWSSVRDDARAADRRRIAGAIAGGVGVALLAVGVVWHVGTNVEVEARANGVGVRGTF